VLAGLDYGTSLGVAGGLAWLLWTFNVSAGWPGAGNVVGTAGGILAAIFLARLRPSAWLRQARVAGNTRRVVDALIAAIVWALVFGWAFLWGTERHLIFLLAVPVLLSSLGVLAVLGFSPASTDRDSALLLRALLTGVLSGATIGALSALAVSYTVSVLTWLSVWVSGGLGAGMIAGMAISLTLRFRDWRRSKPATVAASLARRWRGTAVTVLAISLAFGIVD
jgi:hypothetical protein